jgi:hypothetical protein
MFFQGRVAVSGVYIKVSNWGVFGWIPKDCSSVKNKKRMD